MNVTTMKNLLQDVSQPDDSKRLSGLLIAIIWYVLRKKTGSKNSCILCSHLTCMAGIPDHANGTKKQQKKRA
jgi:hypothetical protein